MKRNRFIATVAAGLGIIALVPVATALGDDEPAPAGQNIEAVVTPLGTAFTYQGRLTDAGSPANGTYDIRFILWDSESGGAQVGGTQEKGDLAVANGLFTTELDFGAGSFNGDARWVEIAVRPGASTAAHTILSPRQPVSPTPYALYAKAAGGVAVPFTATGGLEGSGPTGLVTVTQTGTGVAISGQRTSTVGTLPGYPGVLGTNSGAGAGVQGESTFAGGVGVRAIGDIGVEVHGAIKVGGATPAAFVHTVDNAGAGQNTCLTDTVTVIDNPLTNGASSALVLVTAQGLTPMALSVVYEPAGCAAGADKWAIVGTLFANGDNINVLVISR